MNKTYEKDKIRISSGDIIAIGEQKLDIDNKVIQMNKIIRRKRNRYIFMTILSSFLILIFSILLSIFVYTKTLSNFKIPSEFEIVAGVDTMIIKYIIMGFLILILLSIFISNISFGIMRIKKLRKVDLHVPDEVRLCNFLKENDIEKIDIILSSEKKYVFENAVFSIVLKNKKDSSFSEFKSEVGYWKSMYISGKDFVSFDFKNHTIIVSINDGENVVINDLRNEETIKENTALKEEIDKLYKDIKSQKEIENKIEKYENSMIELKNQNKDLEKQILIKNGEFIKLKNEYKNDLIKEVEKETKRLSNENVNMSLELENMKKEYDNVFKKLEIFKEENSFLKNSQKEIEFKLKENENQNKELRNENIKLSEEFKTVKKENENIKKKENELIKKEKDFNDSIDEINKLKNELDIYTKNKNIYETQLDNLKNLLNENKIKIENLENENALSKKLASEYKLKMEKALNENKNLRESLIEIKNELSSN